MSTKLTETDDLSPITVASGALARLKSRAAALVVLGTVLALLVFVVRSVYFVVTDSWVAPVHLSPQNDAVLQLQVKLSREQAEMERVAVEIERIDGDLAAVDAAIVQLSALRAGSSAPLTWQADVHASEQATLERVIGSLREEIQVLERAHARQAELTTAARHDLEAGLIVQRDLQQQEQALDGLAVGLAEKRRMLDQARHEARVVANQTSAYREGVHDAGAPSGGQPPASVMPEVAASQERSSRTELELLRLQAERRNLVGMRRVAEQGLARQQELLRELESRPLYRAIHASIDVAFVPYDQLDHVKPGARVMACTWSLILCEHVGTVTEVLPGEVATLDPWGEMARGQYAILDLSEPDAVRRKVLRIR
jgi:hypothetical protein